MKNSLLGAAWVKRLLACLAGGVVLAMMVGNQEGSTTSYSSGFRASVLQPRIVVFLVIGLVIFAALTFRARLVPYLARPGFWPLVSGALAIVAGQALMNWNDQLGNSKFGDVRSAIDAAPDAVSGLTRAYFDWLSWLLLALVVAGGLVTVILRSKVPAAVVAVISVAAAIITYLSHADVTDATKSRGPDHSLGWAAVVLGYLVVVSAVGAAGLSKSDRAQGRQTLNRITGQRPGLVLAGLGLILGVLGLTIATWFSPGNRNLDVSGTHDILVGSSASSFTLTYLNWLAWVLLIVTVAFGAAAAWLGHRLLGIAAGVVGVVTTISTVVVLYDISDTGAKANHFDNATGPWQNLGAGGWMTAAGMFLAGAAGLLAAWSGRPSSEGVVSPGGAVALESVIVAEEEAPKRSLVSGVHLNRTILLVAAAAALFYPPTATPFWQQVFVSEIGISMLLAVGLNVVVGWAGLLDLGFIAFYAIGSYTTAYLTGSLPTKPPSWLELSPLWAIPFAIVVCLLAGILLGAPTLRLRGDYLAIVTLGFGEIIRIVAVNADSFTKGSQGPDGIPNPSIHVGGLHIRWGLNQLQYWYLLLVIFVIVVLAFRRLEHSRLGRSWAAVREDEVAAQSMGIDTTRTKLLAFAIGASTSGVAGVFFATQVGSFTPDNFVLNNSILIVAYVVFGGMGSLSGAMAGAAMLTWLPRFLQDQVPQQDKLMWIGAVVILMMIFRPAGLLPARRRRIELEHGLDDEPRSEPRAVPAAEGL